MVWDLPPPLTTRTRLSSAPPRPLREFIAEDRAGADEDGTGKRLVTLSDVPCRGRRPRNQPARVHEVARCC